jgi:photosystem II stability/assembly factor-like uncharacterized protein
MASVKQCRRNSKMMRVIKNSLKYLATLAIVSALAACGGSDGVSEPVFDPTIAPKNVQVVAGGDASDAVWNTVSWNSVSAATDYVVFWSGSPGVTDSSNTLTAVSNHLTHEGLPAGQAYYYRVQARSYGETSVISEEAQGTPQGAITANNLHDVAWDGAETLVAVGDSGYIINSSNGTLDDWSLAFDNPVKDVVNTIAGVTWDGTQFLVVGSGGTILTSSDGDSWIEGDTGINVDLESIIWTGSQYIVVGGSSGSSGTILISENGTDWAVANSIPSNVDNSSLNGVASDSNVIVAVGTNGVLLSSDDDGVTWADLSQDINTNANLNDVTWDGGQFVVVGSDDTIITSPDGIDWTFRVPGSPNIAFVGVTQWDAYLPDPALKGAVGSSGNIWVSDDAVSWVHVPSGTNQRLEGMTYVDDRTNPPYFVIVGHDGTVLTNQR